MKVPTSVTAFLLSGLLLAVACGGSDQSAKGDEQTAQKGEEVAQSQQVPASEVEAPKGPARQAIPDAAEIGTAEPGVELVPSFSPDGMDSVLAVAPGEVFEVYICAAHPREDMASATYRLDVPDGIEVLGESKVFPQSLSIGTHEQYFVVTYPCHHGAERYAVLKYSCRALDSLQSGEFHVGQAIPVNEGDPPFRGFVTCGYNARLVPASGGSATVTRK